MGLVFGGDFDYDRGGLVLVALAMGLYLSAATLNQALLAQGRARQAAICWVGSAAGVRGVPACCRRWTTRCSRWRWGCSAARPCLCTLLLTLYRRA